MQDAVNVEDYCRKEGRLKFKLQKLLTISSSLSFACEFLIAFLAFLKQNIALWKGTTVQLYKL